MYEADVIINLPVLKNHWDAVITSAIKNIGIGAAPPRIYGLNAANVGRNNMVNHGTLGLHQWIADYYAVLPAHFTIVDALQGLQRGPLPGGSNETMALTPNQKNMRSILASRDGLAVDVVQANIMNFDYSNIPYLTFLTERGHVGTHPDRPVLPVIGDPRDIIVLGNISVDDIRENFEGNTPVTPNTGRRLTSADLVQPAISIISASFSGENLYLDLDVSANTVKVDVFIDGIYAGSVNNNLSGITINTSQFPGGSRVITVRSYTRFMRHNAAFITAVKL
jgi:hypothetical protein